MDGVKLATTREGLLFAGITSAIIIISSGCQKMARTGPLLVSSGEWSDIQGSATGASSTVHIIAMYMGFAQLVIIFIRSHIFIRNMILIIMDCFHMQVINR